MSTQYPITEIDKAGRGHSALGYRSPPALPGLLAPLREDPACCLSGWWPARAPLRFGLRRRLGLSPPRPATAPDDAASKPSAALPVSASCRLERAAAGCGLKHITSFRSGRSRQCSAMALPPDLGVQSTASRCVELNTSRCIIEPIDGCYEGARNMILEGLRSHKLQNSSHTASVFSC